MTSTLGDLLLGFLADRPGTAYELQQRHAETFGPQRVVDVTRVGATLHRQERLGFVQTSAAARGTRRVCALTDAGRRRHRAWMLDVPPDLGTAQALDRVLLAMSAADRATFDAVVAACLAVLTSQRPVAGGPEAVVSAGRARAEFEDIVTGSVLLWLRELAGRPRRRDVAA